MFTENEANGITAKEIKKFLSDLLTDKKPGKVLLIPPDYTRRNSGAGLITSLLYSMLDGVQVDILPALGTHAPMTREEQIAFFGDEIPAERYLVHDWRNNISKIGEIPGSFVREVSEGLIDDSIDVEVSRHLPDPSYDLILSIGQVVPHEVAGMANYTKNIVVGCGGSDFINKSHMLGAFYGIERILGKDHTPVRKVFDYAQEHFISGLGVEYILTVTAAECDETKILGLYTGTTRECFERAVALSQKHNMTRVSKPLNTCVVWLDEKEYHSAWLGNKAIYRTRMAMADGGNLIILAPGVCRFGEDEIIDRLIRRYGYCGRDKILELCNTEPELKENLSAAAHLIHGSADGRFTVTYAAPNLSCDDIESVGFKYMQLDKAVKQYELEKLKKNNIGGEYYSLSGGTEIFYIDNPALGLWTI